jgi:hypothetical protein
MDETPHSLTDRNCVISCTQKSEFASFVLFLRPDLIASDPPRIINFVNTLESAAAATEATTTPNPELCR